MTKPSSRQGKAGNQCETIRIQRENDERVLKWIGELSVAARFLITCGMMFASVQVGIFGTLWFSDFGDRNGAIEIQAEAARAERADISDESRQREESREWREEMLVAHCKIQEVADESIILLRGLLQNINVHVSRVNESGALTEILPPTVHEQTHSSCS